MYIIHIKNDWRWSFTRKKLPNPTPFLLQYLKLAISVEQLYSPQHRKPVKYIYSYNMYISYIMWQNKPYNGTCYGRYNYVYVSTTAIVFRPQVTSLQSAPENHGCLAPDTINSQSYCALVVFQHKIPKGNKEKNTRSSALV